MPLPLIGGALSDAFVLRLSVCLTSFCRVDAYIGPNSRTARPRKTTIGTEVAHVTCDSVTTLKVKRSKVKVKAALLSSALTRKAAAAVSVGTYWPWELTATLRSALCRRGRLGGEALWRPRRELGEGRGHIVAAARLQLVLVIIQLLFLVISVSVDYPSKFRSFSIVFAMGPLLLSMYILLRYCV